MRYLTVPGFLDAAACRQVRRAMDAGVPEPAAVLGHDAAVDEAARRALDVEVDEATLGFVEERLERIRDRVARFFGVPLPGREGTGFVRYPPGGFFGPHRDAGDVPAWPDAARRRVALVVFLNTSREADPAGSFTGGVLRVLDGHPSGPVDVYPWAGTLVAFPAAWIHEVTPVRDGVRDTVVDWLY